MFSIYEANPSCGEIASRSTWIYFGASSIRRTNVSASSSVVCRRMKRNGAKSAHTKKLHEFSNSTGRVNRTRGQPLRVSRARKLSMTVLTARLKTITGLPTKHFSSALRIYGFQMAPRVGETQVDVCTAAAGRMPPNEQGTRTPDRASASSVGTTVSYSEKCTHGSQTDTMSICARWHCARLLSRCRVKKFSMIEVFGGTGLPDNA